jgi:hypothetical protein
VRRSQNKKGGVCLAHAAFCGASFFGRRLLLLDVTLLICALKNKLFNFDMLQGVSGHLHGQHGRSEDYNAGFLLALTGAGV